MHWPPHKRVFWTQATCYTGQKQTRKDMAAAQNGYSRSAHKPQHTWKKTKPNRHGPIRHKKRIFIFCTHKPHTPKKTHTHTTGASTFCTLNKKLSYVPVQHGDRGVEPEELGVQVRPRLPIAAGVLTRDLDARLARRVPGLELAMYLIEKKDKKTRESDILGTVQ